MKPVTSSLIDPLINSALNFNLQALLESDLAEKKRQEFRRQEFLAHWAKIDEMVTPLKKAEIEKSLLNSVKEWLISEDVLPQGYEHRGPTLQSITRNDDDDDRYKIQQYRIEIQTRWETKNVYFSVESYSINGVGELEWELNIPGSLEPDYGC